MMRSILLAALMLATPAMAECPGTWLPPIQYDFQPRPTPIYRLVDDVPRACTELGGMGTGNLAACNGWKDRKWYIVLDKARTVDQLRCDVRHEFGHQNERDATGDPNDWHTGWRLGT